MKKSIMLLALLFNTVAYGESQLKDKDLGLWHQYAPKECYESLSSSGTAHSADVSLRFTLISTRDSSKMSYSGTSGDCVIHSAVQISFKDKPGLSWGKGSCADKPVSWSDPLPPSGHENICYAKKEGVSNVKLTMLNEKQVLYAEFPTVNGLTKVWYNLEPFHPVQEYTISPGQSNTTWTHTNVKINEPVDKDEFALPDDETPPDNGSNPYTGIACTVTGAWFDPEQNGSGFNLINTPSGYVMYFYGYKGGVNGEPLWLLSDVGPTDLSVGESFELTMYSGFVGNDGSFSTKPSGGRSGLKEWGTAKISFTSDATGVITLSGKDGTITHNIQRLTAVQGLDCSGVAPTENRFSLTGAWYDTAYTGSGFNIIDTTSGFAMYFYGYQGNANGKTLWLLSDVGDKNIVKGKTYTLPVYSGYSGNGGSFTQKPTVGNSGVKEWGKATFTFTSCNQGVITLAGNDGTITHNVQRLVGVNALQCSE